MRKPKVKNIKHYHKDGTIWAKGKMLGDKMHDYWEWYRKGGVIMRSGYFDHGVQVGEWTTYDKQGEIYKVTKMKSKDYTISFLVAQTPSEVFNAINNVRGWWSETLKGNSQKLNDVFIYEHKPYHRSKQRLIEVIPDKKVTWLVTESAIHFVKDKNEWKNTKICFEIFKQRNKTKMVFTHFGLAPQIECYNNCSKGWSYYLKESLFKLITTGKGKPDKKEK